jgi:hypothetical protein
LETDRLGDGAERLSGGNALCCRRVVTRARIAFVNLVVLLLIGGSLYDIATDQEHWPFSQYPMFSGVWRSPTFTWLRLFGVTADGREFPLETNKYITPFDQSRLPKALRRMLDERDGDARVRAALADCLARYDQLRADDRLDAPPLVALRLYELEWTIDPHAANVEQPDHRRFIAEVRP